MHRSAPTRLAGVLALGLLLLTMGGGSALGAARAATDHLAAAPAVARAALPATLSVVPQGVVSPLAFPASSCQGTNACDFVTGTVGDNSCNGNHACYGAGTVGDNSCNGSSPCYQASAIVGDNACNGDDTCDEVHGNVGDNSCDGFGACEFVTSVGENSCTGDISCYTVAGSVGNNSCNGVQACFSAAASVGDCADNLPGLVPALCLVTRTVMGSSATPSVFGQPLHVWATVQARYPNAGIPAGTFQFRLDGRPLGSPVAIDSHGRAHLTLHLRAGVHWVTGRYRGDGIFAPSVAVRLYQLVVRP